MPERRRRIYGAGSRREVRPGGGKVARMMSTVLMKCLIGAYITIMITCLIEKNYPRALYWFSAGLITTSVLWGMK